MVGQSGAGKSTLVNLAIGFRQPTNGEIFLDGKNLRGLDLRTYRRQIGVVLQDGKLQPGNIFNNIVGSTLMTEDDAWEAARLAGFEFQRLAPAKSFGNRVRS